MEILNQVKPVTLIDYDYEGRRVIDPFANEASEIIARNVENFVSELRFIFNII